MPLDVAFAGDDRMDRMEKTQMFAQPSANADYFHGEPAALFRRFKDASKVQLSKALKESIEEDRIGVADPQSVAGIASFRVKDAGQEAFPPVEGRKARPSNEVSDMFHMPAGAGANPCIRFLLARAS